MITEYQADLWLADLDNLFASILESVTNGEAGTVGETAYTGYGREQISLGAAADGYGGRTRANDLSVTFGENTGAQVTGIAVGLHTLVSGGSVAAIAYLDGLDPTVATGADTGDLFTAPSHGLANDDRVRVMDAGESPLPTGVSENTTYWVINVSGQTFQLSTSQGGAAATLTADGACVVMPLTPINIPTNNAPQFAVGTLEFGVATH